MGLGVFANQDFVSEFREALRRDRTIDIVTKGAKTGSWRTTEIWFTRIDERIVICGTPGASDSGGVKYQPRSWLANLLKNPSFWFCLKESMQCCVLATARPISLPDDRYYVMSHEATSWYREHGPSVEEMVLLSPIIEVEFS